MGCKSCTFISSGASTVRPDAKARATMFSSERELEGWLVDEIDRSSDEGCDAADAAESADGNVFRGIVADRDKLKSFDLRIDSDLGRDYI